MAERTTALKIMVALSVIGGELLIALGLAMTYIGGLLFMQRAGSVNGLSDAIFAVDLDHALGLYSATSAIAIGGFLIFIAGALGLFLAWGLWNMKPRARILATIYCVIGLVGFPIGTIMGIIFIYFLWFDAKTKALFG